MMGNKYFLNILLWLMITFACYNLTVFATPYIVLLVVKSKAKAVYNVPVLSDVVDEQERRVVMPNPDFLYVVLGYDVRNNPIRITGLMPDTSYASVALYASNTENYFVMNDKQLRTKKFDFILAADGSKTLKARFPNSEIITAQSTIGTVMMRILITEPERIPYLINIQRNFNVETIPQRY